MISYYTRDELIDILIEQKTIDEWYGWAIEPILINPDSLSVDDAHKEEQRRLKTILFIRKESVKKVFEKHDNCNPIKLCEHGDGVDDFCYHVMVEDLEL